MRLKETHNVISSSDVYLSQCCQVGDEGLSYIKPTDRCARVWPNDAAFKAIRAYGTNQHYLSGNYCTILYFQGWTDKCLADKCLRQRPMFESPPLVLTRFAASHHNISTPTHSYFILDVSPH